MTLTKPQTKAELVPLAALVVDQGINPRAGGTSEETAQEYAAALEAGDEFPPAVVYRDRQGTLRLSEGFTRHRAYEINQSYAMPCVVRPGDRRDAAINAAASNRDHGQRRSNADKRRAIEIVLAVEPGWTDRRVAAAAFVTDKTVADVRAGMVASAEIPQLATRVGLDGRERSLPRCEPVSSPARGGPLPPPDPRASFEADVVVLCLKLSACRAELERLAAAEFGRTVRHRKALPALEMALTAVWADRPGGPPGGGP